MGAAPAEPQAAAPVSVVSLGTCRLDGPLRSLVAEAPGEARWLNEDVYGFVHSIPEIVQLIRFLDGVDLPDDYARYISARGPFAAERKPMTPDVWLVEISSLKVLAVGGVYLQLNVTKRWFEDAPELFEIMRKLPRETDKPARAEKLRAHPDFATRDAIDQATLLDMTIVNTTPKEFEAGMLAIREALGARVVFVPHVNVRPLDGDLIKARVEIARLMADVAQRHGLHVHDPAALVERRGLEVAMAKDGADLNHYADDFLAEVGRDFLERAIRPLVAPAAV